MPIMVRSKCLYRLSDVEQCIRERIVSCNPQTLDEFRKNYMELHRIVRDNASNESEYKHYMDSLKSSVLTAFYTPEEIVSALADTLHQHGITPQRLLDPSAGQGVFIAEMEKQASNMQVMAFEKDLLTGKLLSHLYPDHKIRIEGFEKIEHPFNNYFDVVVSNIPFGDIAVFDPLFSGSRDNARRQSTKSIHNYFFMIDPSKYSDHPDNKASRCAKTVAEYYHKYEAQKGTQFVFSDLGTYQPGAWHGEQEKDLEAQMRWLGDSFSCATVCVTRAENGAAMLHNGIFTEHPGFHVEVENTIGSGDAFLASFVSGIFNDEVPDQIVNDACALGAYVATFKGANPEYNIDEIKCKSTF